MRYMMAATLLSWQEGDNDNNLWDTWWPKAFRRGWWLWELTSPSSSESLYDHNHDHDHHDHHLWDRWWLQSFREPRMGRYLRTPRWRQSLSETWTSISICSGNVILIGDYDKNQRVRDQDTNRMENQVWFDKRWNDKRIATICSRESSSCRRSSTDLCGSNWFQPFC